jgi:hypothetical protein
LLIVFAFLGDDKILNRLNIGIESPKSEAVLSGMEGTDPAKSHDVLVSK